MIWEETSEVSYILIDNVYYDEAGQQRSSLSYYHQPYYRSQNIPLFFHTTIQHEGYEISKFGQEMGKKTGVRTIDYQVKINKARRFLGEGRTYITHDCNDLIIGRFTGRLGWGIHTHTRNILDWFVFIRASADIVYIGWD